MATTATVKSGARDRHVYTWAAVFIPIIVLIGFARSYYLKGLFHTPALPGMLVHLHGAVMTCWVVLFVLQVSLVATRRTRVHQRLGVAAAVVAALVVVVGIATAISSTQRNAAAGPGALQFLAVPLGDMLVFAVLVGTALYFRRRPEIHKRLMLVAALSLLSAAIARIPLHFIAVGGPLVFLGLTDLSVLVCVVVDTARNRKLHRAFLWSTLLLIASQALRLAVAGTDAWMRVAAWLIGR